MTPVTQQIRNNYYAYILRDANNVPFYVGKGYGARMYSHVTEARKPKSEWTNPHKCSKILKILKSGGTVQYEVIICSSEKDALLKENKLITLYRRTKDGGTLTNISKEGCVANPKKRKVKQYDLAGALVCEHNSVVEAARSVGLTCPNKLWTMLSAGESGKYNKTLKGYQFRYSDSPSPGEYRHSQSKRVVVQSTSNTCIVFDSASKAARYIGCAASTIRNICNGNTKQKPIKGWTVRYQDTKNTELE